MPRIRSLSFGAQLLATALVILSACEQELTLDGEDVTESAEKQGAQVANGDIQEITTTIADDGAATGKLSADSNETQKLSAPEDSSVGGAAAQFPPGALRLDTDITIEEGEDLVNEEFAGSLGFDPNKFDPASKAVLVSSSNQEDPLEPFTLQIPLDPSFGLQGEDALDRLLMFYKRIKYAEGGKVTLGLLPREDLQIDDGVVNVDSSFYGVFQAVLAKEIIEQAAEKIADAVIKDAGGEVAVEPVVVPSFNLVIGFAGAIPASPSADQNPKVKGIGSSAVETVKIYSDPDCTAEIASGTRDEFQTTGITATIPEDQTSFLFAKAFGANESQSFCTNLTTYTHDGQAPTQVGNVSDGASYCDDGDATTTVSWSAASDTGSGLDRYEVSAGTSAGQTDLAPWTGAGLGTSAKVSGINLDDGNSWYVNIRAIDKVGNISVASTDGCLVDESAPAAPAISSFDTDTSGGATFAFTASDSHSGLSSIEYALGTTSGATDVISWTSLAPTATSANITIPSYDAGQRYYLMMRATNNAGLVSATSSADAIGNLSMDFSGSANHYVDGGNDARLDITGNLSVSTWIKIDALPPANDSQIVVKGDMDIGHGWQIFVDRFGKFGAAMFGRYKVAATTLATGQWYHVVMTVDGNTVNLYVDGTIDGTETMAAMWTPQSVATGVKIGAIYRPGMDAVLDAFEGSIDEVAIWDLVLSPAAIQEIYDAAPGFDLASPPSGLNYQGSDATALQYWLRMGETFDGTDLEDSSGKTPAITATFEKGLSGTDIQDDFFQHP